MIIEGIRKLRVISLEDKVRHQQPPLHHLRSLLDALGTTSVERRIDVAEHLETDAHSEERYDGYLRCRSPRNPRSSPPKIRHTTTRQLPRVTSSCWTTLRSSALRPQACDPTAECARTQLILSWSHLQRQIGR